MKDVLPFLVGPGWLQGAAGALWVLQLAGKLLQRDFWGTSHWQCGWGAIIAWFGLTEIIASGALGLAQRW